MTATDTAPAAIRHADRGSGVTQLRVLRSEWIKQRSLRSTWYTFALATIGLIAVGLLVSWATNRHWAEMDPRERALFDPVGRSLSGVYLSQLAVGVLGVLVISGEYATGMVRSTFAAVPRRLPVLWAKLVVFCSMTFVLTLVSAVVAFTVGQQLLASHGTTFAAGPHALRSIVGVALYLTVVGVLGVGLGFLIRNTAGGIATLFGLLLVLPAIVHVLPSSWQDNILPYLPNNAGSVLFTAYPDPGSLSPWAGFAVMCAWGAAAVIGAAVVLTRRDA